MTMAVEKKKKKLAVELRVTAITGVFRAAEWTESEWTASGKCLQSCHRSHHRVFMCTILRKII